jgi:hypothetical protein
LDTSSLLIEYPFPQLEQLVDPKEDILFFVNGDRDKFWFYQGKIAAIVKVILESTMAERLRHISFANHE